MCSLKSDLIYFPAFEHCHNKTSRPGSLESRACYTQLSPGLFLPPGLLFPICPVTSNGLNINTLEKVKLLATLNKAHGLTGQSTHVFTEVQEQAEHKEYMVATHIGYWR